MVQDYKMNFIYEIEKNKITQGSKKFKNRILSQYGYEDDGELYRKVVNYQVQKYGSTLVHRVELPNREMKEKIKHKVRNRNYYRRNKNGISKY